MYNKSTRSYAEHITEKKEKPHHIGKKSGAVLQQEFFSAINTKEAFRDSKWKKTYSEIVENILKLKEGDLILSSFKSKYGHLGRIPN